VVARDGRHFEGAQPVAYLFARDCAHRPACKLFGKYSQTRPHIVDVELRSAGLLPCRDKLIYQFRCRAGLVAGRCDVSDKKVGRILDCLAVGTQLVGALLRHHGECCRELRGLDFFRLYAGGCGMGSQGYSQLFTTFQDHSSKLLPGNFGVEVGGRGFPPEIPAFLIGSMNRAKGHGGLRSRPYAGTGDKIRPLRYRIHWRINVHRFICSKIAGVLSRDESRRKAGSPYRSCTRDCRH